jgi:antirestriction factor ArdC-like protein
VQLQVFASSGLQLTCGHFSHTVALAALAGVGQGQGVFVSKHSTAIQKRRIHPMSSIITTNETSSVTSLPSTSKAQTAKEVIAVNVKLLIEQLEAGHSEGLTAYLIAMGRFNNYSFGNILEIARQKPDTTRVAGIYGWNQLGRKVIKGQKGIRILAPMIGARRNKDKEAERDINKQNQPVLVGFRSAYVFDVSQTEGAALPDLSERVKGEVGEYRERLMDFLTAQGIELEFKESQLDTMAGRSRRSSVPWCIYWDSGQVSHFSSLHTIWAHLQLFSGPLIFRTKCVDCSTWKCLSCCLRFCRKSSATRQRLWRRV